jgi:hypothetical protein
MAKRWTKQEDEILAKFIENGKLPKAISEVSVSLGRTEKAVYARYYSKKNPNPTKSSCFYTKEETKIVLDYITDPKNTNLQGLMSQLNRSKPSIYLKIKHLREQHPELKIRKFTNLEAMNTKDLKQIFSEEITNSKHNLRQAFRNIAERTGLSPKTIASYWYEKGISKGRDDLNRKNMPALFYTSDSKGASKNEKNSNVIQVSKGKYLFNMITSWLNNKFKVKSTTKKSSK